MPRSLSLTVLIAVLLVTLMAPMSAHAVFKQVDRFGQSLSGHIGASGSRDLASDPAGNIYVAEPQHAKITKYSPTGIVLAQRGYGDAQGIAIGTSGTVYVTDSTGSQVIEYSSELQLQRFWKRSSAPLPLTGGNNRGKVAIAVDESRDALYIGSYNGLVVEQYSISGFPDATNTKPAVATFRPAGSSSSFEQVRGIEVDSLSRVYTLEGQGLTNRVHRFAATGGTPQASWLVPGSGTPSALALDISQNMFVSLFSDTASPTTCVVKLASGTGSSLGAIGGGIGRPAWFSQAFGLDVQPSGDLLVASSNETVRFSETASGATPDSCPGL